MNSCLTYEDDEEMEEDEEDVKKSLGISVVKATSGDFKDLFVSRISFWKMFRFQCREPSFISIRRSQNVFLLHSLRSF